MGVEVQRIVGSGKRWPPDLMSDPAYVVMVDGRKSFTLTMADVEETVRASVLGPGVVVANRASADVVETIVRKHLRSPAIGHDELRSVDWVALDAELTKAFLPRIADGTKVTFDEGKKIYDRGWNDGIDAFKRNYDGMVEVIRRLRS